MEVAEFLDSAISSQGKCFVNCVFGRSRFVKLINSKSTLRSLSLSVCRSTTCVVVYLMLKYDWEALQALRHIRQARPVEVDTMTGTKDNLTLTIISR